MRTEEKHYQCPACRTQLPYYSRYPRYVCESCMDKATDICGKRVRFFNVGIHGGIKAEYVDSGKVYNYQECYIDGIKCVASDAYMGGIVIELVT